MPAGLTIYNTDSTVQIDQDWRNFAFKQKIPVFFDITLPNVTPYLTYTLVVPGEKALVAVKAATFRVIAVNSWFDGANYTYNYYLIPPVTTGYVSETVEFFVFDVPPSSAFSNVGLEVFDAVGKTVFHSDMKPMKIAGIRAGMPPPSFIGTPGRTYVPMVGVNPVFVDGGRVYGYGLRVVGSDILPQQVITPKSSPFGWTNIGSYAAIDVTGL